MAHRTRRRSLWPSLGDRTPPRLNRRASAGIPVEARAKILMGQGFSKPEGVPQHLNCACFSDGAAMPSVSSCAALIVSRPQGTSIPTGIASESAFRASRSASRFRCTHRNTIPDQSATTSVARLLAPAVVVLAHFRSCRAKAHCRYSRPSPDRSSPPPSGWEAD